MENQWGLSMLVALKLNHSSLVNKHDCYWSLLPPILNGHPALRKEVFVLSQVKNVLEGGNNVSIKLPYK